MPALPFAPGIARITIKQTLASVNVYNVLHAYEGNPAGWAQSELDALVAAVRSAWVTNVIPLQSNSLSLSDVTAVDLTSDIGYSSTATGTTAGGLASAAAPANTCVCWSWKIANRYRGGHPRTYIAGLAQANVLNANSITSTHRTAHATAAAAIRTAINGVATGGGTAQMGCVSYYKNGAVRPAPFFFNFIGVSVDDRIDSQRRRLGRDR